MALRPPPTFDPCCVHFGAPYPFKAHELVISPDGQCRTDFYRLDRLCGCAFLLTREFAPVFRDIYFKVFNEYVQRDWFVGKDQSIMNTASVEHADRFRIVDANTTVCGRWWTLAYYLFGQMPEAVPYRLPARFAGQA